MRNSWWRYSVMKRARELRAELGLGDHGPLADLFLTVRDAVGLQVVVIAMDEGSAGAYVPHPLGPVVFVNIEHAPVRQRFTLAHELGHHHLHEGGELDQVADLGDVTDPRERRPTSSPRNSSPRAPPCRPSSRATARTA